MLFFCLWQSSDLTLSADKWEEYSKLCNNSIVMNPDKVLCNLSAACNKEDMMQTKTYFCYPEDSSNVTNQTI